MFDVATYGQRSVIIIIVAIAIALSDQTLAAKETKQKRDIH